MFACSNTLSTRGRSRHHSRITVRSAIMKSILVTLAIALSGMSAAMPLSNTTLSRRADCVPPIDPATRLYSLNEAGETCEGRSVVGLGPCSKDIAGQFGCTSEAAKADTSKPSTVYRCMVVANDGMLTSWIRWNDCTKETLSNEHGNGVHADPGAAGIRPMCAGIRDKQDSACCGVWNSGNSRAECISW